MSKKNILFYGDSPTANTGLGNVSRHILRSLYDTGKYNITVIGLNHHVPYYDHDEFPYVIIPSMFDQRDTEKLARFMTIESIKASNYDYLFLNYDPDVLNFFIPAIEEVKKKKDIDVVSYFPIDSPFCNQVHKNIVDISDYPVAYSNYARDLILKDYPQFKNKLKVIYHGTDTDIFKPIEHRIRQNTRKKILGLKEDDFLIINVNRFQWRKDLYRTLVIFMKFWQKCQCAKLYLHCAVNDMGGNLGGLIQSIAAFLKIPPEEILKNIITTGDNHSINQGIAETDLNLLYNAADVFLSTTLGEGWGLTTTEAMACELPILISRNTTAEELIGDTRGYLIDGSGHYEVPSGWTTIPRETVDIEHGVTSLRHIYHNLHIAKKKGRAAREWVLRNTWDIIGKKWVELFNATDQIIC